MKKFVIAIIFTLFLGLRASSGHDLNKVEVVQAIMGEGRGEGRSWDDWEGKKISMTAIAEAIRNRGTLKGVYGRSAKNNDPVWIKEKCEKLAIEAWEDSETTNLTNGATHWENVKAFGEPWWAKSMSITAEIGNHVFYKERRK